MRTLRWAVLAAVTALGLVAARQKAHPPTAASAPTERRSPAAPAETEQKGVASGYDPVPFGHRTTSGQIAEGNLSARIDSMAALLKRDPGALGLRKSLVDALLSRTQFFGTFSDFDRARALVEPPSAKSTTAELDEWAAVAGALHEFESALDALELAQKRDGVSRDAQRTTLALARGRGLPAVLAARRTAAAANPSFETFAGLAAAEAAAGRFEDADATYRRALETYRDVSPFPVAWVEFQRGMMWAEAAGRPDRAVPLYREALARLPGYVVASVHLSEIEAETGDRESAIQRLRPLAATAEDPEPAAVLAKLLADTSPTEARRFAGKARRRYEALLATHRNAFLDHAAEFFAGPGRAPRRALALAEENLKLRPTDRAYALAIRTATAAGASQRACELSREAGEGRTSIVLERLRSDVLKGCAPSST